MILKKLKNIKYYIKVFTLKVFKLHTLYISLDLNGIKKFSDSFVGNFLQWIYANFSNNSTNFLVSESFFNNTRTSIHLPGAAFGTVTSLATCNANVSDDSFGIVVGSGTNIPTAQDTSLQTKITNGTGAGQLVYQPQTSSKGTTTNGQNTEFILTRTFQNLSGGTVSVNEIGLILNAAGNKFLVIRDLQNYSIPTGKTLTVNISFNTIS